MMIDMCDTDNSGGCSKAELKALIPDIDDVPGADGFFDMVDADGSGEVTAAEIV